MKKPGVGIASFCQALGGVRRRLAAFSA